MFLRFDCPMAMRLAKGPERGKSGLHLDNLGARTSSSFVQKVYKSDGQIYNPYTLPGSKRGGVYGPSNVINLPENPKTCL